MPYYGGTPQAADPRFLMDRLMRGGMSRMQAAAVVGNLQHESSLHTNAVNPDEGAYGLMQWRGDRFTSLQEFAAKQGKSWMDPGVQADFIGHELRTTERGNATEFGKATDLDSATKAFGNNVVRFGDDTLAERQVNARAIYNSPITQQATGAPPTVSRETSQALYGSGGPLGYAGTTGLLNSPTRKGIRGGIETLGEGLGMAFRPRAPGSLFAGATGASPGNAAAAGPSKTPARDQLSSVPPEFPGGIVPAPMPRPETAPDPMTPDRDAVRMGALADFSTYRDSVDYGVG